MFVLLMACPPGPDPLTRVSSMSASSSGGSGGSLFVLA